MQIYLIRHTETICEKGICYGQSDIKLKENYLNDFQKIYTQIPKLAHVYSSPLLRCKILAEYLYPHTHIHFDQQLKEMNFGNWELMRWDEIPRDELNKWMDDFVYEIVPNGESFTQLYARVINFWEQISSIKTNLPIVIITHAGVIRSLLCYFQKISLKKAFDNKIEFGQVISLNY